MALTTEQMRIYMRTYRAERRQEAIKLLGGHCVVCGSTEDLQFDHIDPSTKSFNISGFFKSKERMLEELKKCQLLCGVHHAEKTSADLKKIPSKAGNNTPHGVLYKYYLGCRCAPCKGAKRLSRK